jgi:hypothetical protein
MAGGPGRFGLGGGGGVAQYGMWADTAPVGWVSRFLFQIIQTFPNDFKRSTLKNTKGVPRIVYFFCKLYQVVDKLKTNNFPFGQKLKFNRI